MPALPSMDLEVFWILDLLHRGERKKAKELVLKMLSAGEAGAETQKLAAELFAAKRGRQSYGAKYRWYDIGVENDAMRDMGISYPVRMDKLGSKYMLSKTQVETAIAEYESIARASNGEDLNS